MVVDDDNMNIMVIQSLLEAQGHDSDSALLPNVALKLVTERIQLYLKGKADFYKLIIMDYSMP